MDKKINHQEDPEAQIENALGKGEQFIEKNGKRMLIALCVVVILIGGYFGYEQLIRAPKEVNAEMAMFGAQKAFANEEFTVALNGDDNTTGFLEIAKNYGATPSGNVANHYAGICYLKNGEYQNAINSLEKYSDVATKEAGIINAQNKGLIGDAYIQLGNKDMAIKFYDMAVQKSDNELTAPYYLHKLGGVYLSQGNNTKAIECYETIKTKYYTSMQARDIDKYIGAAKK